jgi:thioredoxin-like negative regulator of GroEL
MLMFYGIVVWAGVRSFSTVFKRSDDAGRLLIGAFWAAAVGYLVQLLFGVSVTGVTFLLWIALAVALAPTARIVEVRAPSWGKVVAVVGVVACAAGIAYTGVAVAADNAYMKSQASSAADQRIAEAKKAIRLFPYSYTYRWGLAEAYMAQMNLYYRMGSEAQQAGEDTAPYLQHVKQSFLDAEAALKDAIAFMPQEYDNYVTLADLYNTVGETINKDYFEQAIDAARRGIAAEPYGTPARVQLARALAGQGKNAEAEKVLRYCLQIDPTSGQAAYTLAALLHNQGKDKEALAVLQAVEAIAPGQQGIAESIARLQAKQQE